MAETNSLPAAFPKDGSLSVEAFTQHPRVLACMAKLKERFPPGAPLVVSDVLDGDGHQYVHLVQKGGGVLGVALVGYTYILEEMGIRFLRLAGTSAGAINTALMTVIGEKREAKSTRVLDAVCGLDFFSLVDGHPVARWLIRKFITNADFSTKAKSWALTAAITGVVLVGADFLLLGLQHVYTFLPFWTGLSFLLTGVYVLILAFLLSYGADLLKRLKNAGFGINPGDIFYDWIKIQLSSNGVHTVSDLNGKANKSARDLGLVLRPGVEHPEGIDDLKGDVTFITSELVTQNKIQFPLMCDLFKTRDTIDTLQPAGFIRASMSIPVFFESYIINGIPCQHDDVKQAWKERFQEDNPPSTARFVDGGILSNFPINVFYNPGVEQPRLPVFGIDLDDDKPENEAMNPSMWSLGGYFGKVFNTVRFYYDKDFLLKNSMYELGIGKIKLAGYNWLNFFLKPQDKVDMFVLGAEAATDFLLNFKWQDYKDNRADKQKKLITK